jgi:hypothetical protein
VNRSSKEWLVPLTGIGFILVLVASFVIVGDEPPEAKDGGQAILDHYSENKDEIMIGSFIGGGLAGVLLIFFFAYVNRLVSAAAQERIMLPVVGIVGAAILATGAAIDSMLQFALAEAADDIEPDAAQAIQAIWDNDFIPFVLGGSLMMLATGLGVVKTGILPKWLGWVAVALGVLMFAGPIGFVGLLVSALWIVVVSVMLSLRARNGSGGAPAPAA